MKRRGKTSTLVTGAVMAVVLAVGGIASKNWIVEQWNIHKLETGDEDEVKAAAKILGELRSERAVPHLVRHLSKWTEEGTWIVLETRIVTVWFNQDVKDALVRIGANAVPALVAALKNENEDGFKCAITWTLGRSNSDK